MADRPGHGGSEDGPDFNWLYGRKGRPDAEPPADNPDATRAIRAQPRPTDDSTRVMSAQPRDPVRPTPPPIAPQPTQPPPGTPYRGGGGSRFRRPKFWIRTVFVLVLLWIVYLVAVPLIAWNKVDKVAFEPDGDRPGDQDGTTYLLVGSDSRGDLTKEERREFGTGNASGQRTDTIMLLHTGSGPNLLMSIPRDSIVDVPGHGTTKINAAYAYGGPELLVQTDRERDRHPGGPLRRDRLRRLRRPGRRRRRDRDLPQAGDERPAGQPQDQEGVPGGRRGDGSRLRALAPHLGASATSTGPGTSARSSRRSAARSPPRGRSSTRSATTTSTWPPARTVNFGEGTSPVARQRCWPRR